MTYLNHLNKLTGLITQHRNHNEQTQSNKDSSYNDSNSCWAFKGDVDKVCTTFCVYTRVLIKYLKTFKTYVEESIARAEARIRDEASKDKVIEATLALEAARVKLAAAILARALEENK